MYMLQKMSSFVTVMLQWLIRIIEKSTNPQIGNIYKEKITILGANWQLFSWKGLPNVYI